MLTLKVSPKELYDDETNTRSFTEYVTLKMEHSLISISLWEAIHHKSFFGHIDDMTDDEKLSYISCMCIHETSEAIIGSLSSDELETVRSYILDSRSATVISRIDGPDRSKRFISSEVIYSYMVALNIPVAFEKWHVNRLINLIELCSMNNRPKGKTSRVSDADLAKRQALNEKRKRELAAAKEAKT